MAMLMGTIELDPKKMRRLEELPTSLCFNTGKMVMADLTNKSRMASAIREATAEKPELRQDYLDALDRLFRP
jgi:hypothetical protein